MPPKGNYLPYIEARDFVRALKLKNAEEWREYYKTKERPSNIPTRPNVVYKNEGWVSWPDWLGTNTRRSHDRKYVVNDDYFKTWSSNMAYILGFWFADGCMLDLDKKHRGNGYIFSITQHHKDRYILESFLKEMKSNYPLYLKGSCYFFNINSKTIFEDVLRLGGEERKSLVCKFPLIPNEYLCDFIRGLWDGDGCIYYNKQNKSYASTYVSGSKSFINELYRSLKKHIVNLGGYIQYESVNKYRLCFSKNDTIRLKKFMYQGILDNKLMLKRKYDLFLKIPDHYTYEFLDYNNAQEIAKTLGIKRWKQWRQYCKDDKIPHNIPRNPDGVYKDKGWVDWYAWFGKTVPQDNKLRA